MPLALGTLCQACAIEERGEDTRDFAGRTFAEAMDVAGFAEHVTCRACGPTLIDHEGACQFDCLKAGLPGHAGRPLDARAKDPEDEPGDVLDDEDDDDDDDDDLDDDLDPDDDDDDEDDDD